MAALPYDVRRAVRRLAAADAGLARLIKHIGPCAMTRQPMPSTFAALAHAIVYQQLSGAAAATIFGRLESTLGRMTPDRVVAVSDVTLRGAGLSRAKTLALRDLAEHCLARRVPGRRALIDMPEEAVIESLTRVRGIGRWSAEMVLIFRLGRPDVLPVTDLGIRKGYAAAWNLDELPESTQLAELGQRWAPYRSVASWYLWRAADNPPPTPSP